jgi:hypothetical protein
MLQNPALSSDKLYCAPQTYDTNKRYRPLKGHVVYGYPSIGGVLIRGVDAVGLLHLNLDRFKEANRSPDPAEEDEFCKRLRNLGAVWWPSEGDEIYALGERDLAEEAMVVETGWPSSGNGVWVLKYDANKWKEKFGAMLLELTLGMDERCQIIKELGGSFFEDPEACEDLRFDTLRSAAK